MAYECWMWLVQEADGKEGLIAAMLSPSPVFPDGPVTLTARTRETADTLEPIARLHAKVTGRPVRLAHMVEAG